MHTPPTTRATPMTAPTATHPHRQAPGTGIAPVAGMTPTPSPCAPPHPAQAPGDSPTTSPLRFVRRGQVQALGNVPPTRTLLELLRDDLGQTGTKEGCRSGDCGACTVVLGEPGPDGHLRYRAVNSCIRLAHSVQGMALWTVEDLTADPLLAPQAGDTEAQAPVATTAPGRGPLPLTPWGAASMAQLHPVQQALVQQHASQCGFCTPGFVMSLFALYQTRVADAAARGDSPEPVSREQALQALSGNLCRCTGYRPILDAAQSMLSHPIWRVNETQVIQQLEQTVQSNKAQEGNFIHEYDALTYHAPTALTELLQARARDPQAQLVAGCTDVGLWITKGQQNPARILDLTRTSALRSVQQVRRQEQEWLEIGAAVSLTDAFAALVATRPDLDTFASRFAGLPVRNAGTLGGNVANGSPIGDSMPLLIALGAQVRLMGWEADVANGNSGVRQREMPLESLYTGYRQTRMAPHELLTHILVPPPGPAALPCADPTRLDGEWLRAYKISKRFEDDISAVCLGLRLVLSHGVVTQASLGVGGVAATPVRAAQTEAALVGQPWTLATATQAAGVLQAEFSPISDMRASASYRRQVLGALLRRTWLESTGTAHINLEHTSLAELTGASA